MIQMIQIDAAFLKSNHSFKKTIASVREDKLERGSFFVVGSVSFLRRSNLKYLMEYKARN